MEGEGEEEGAVAIMAGWQALGGGQCYLQARLERRRGSIIRWTKRRICYREAQQGARRSARGRARMHAAQQPAEEEQQASWGRQRATIGHSDVAW